jgi:hypothetical protein
LLQNGGVMKKPDCSLGYQKATRKEAGAKRFKKEKQKLAKKRLEQSKNQRDWG